MTASNRKITTQGVIWGATCNAKHHPSRQAESSGYREASNYKYYTSHMFWSGAIIIDQAQRLVSSSIKKNQSPSLFLWHLFIKYYCIIDSRVRYRKRVMILRNTEEEDRSLCTKEKKKGNKVKCTFSCA